MIAHRGLNCEAGCWPVAQKCPVLESAAVQVTRGGAAVKRLHSAEVLVEVEANRVATRVDHLHKHTVAPRRWCRLPAAQASAAGIRRSGAGALHDAAMACAGASSLTGCNKAGSRFCRQLERGRYAAVQRRPSKHQSARLWAEGDGMRRRRSSACSCPGDDHLPERADDRRVFCKKFLKGSSIDARALEVRAANAVKE